MNIPLLLNSYKNKSFLGNNDLKKILNSFIFLFLILISSNFFSQTFTKTTVGNKVTLKSVGTGSNSWVVPCGVTSITIHAYGGGGGGGKTDSNHAKGGTTGGGGGGAYASSTWSVAEGSSVTFSIGVGGTGAEGTINNGNDTTVQTTTQSIKAKGGIGAIINQIVGGAGGLAGQSIGTKTFAGGNGGNGGDGNGVGPYTAAGGGGGAGMIDAVGENGKNGRANNFTTPDGEGGKSNFEGGTGGKGAGEGPDVAKDGFSYGGGGGGVKKASSGSGTVRNGGAGGAGGIVIEYTLPTTPTVSVTSITSTSALINWTGSGGYIIEYGVTGFTPGTGATAGTGGTIATSSGSSPYSYNLSGLTSNIIYDVYVRQVCNSTYSANSAKVSFKTLQASCVTPSLATQLSFTGNVTTTGSFTTSPSAPTGYLIVRRTNNSAEFTPVNGVSYPIGVLGNYNVLRGTVAPNSNTTFTDTPGIGVHYYYIYAFNSNCLGGPFYSKVLKGQQTLSCTPTGNDTRYIKNVRFLGTLSPDTENPTTTSTNQYGNYTHLTERAKQIEGGVINLAVDVNAASTVRMKAWVDWNRNGAYTNDATEIVYDPSSGKPKGLNVLNVIFGFKVPVGTAPGIYTVRIRIKNKEGSVPLDPCTNSDGETEDYSFEVVTDSSAKIVAAPTARKCGAGLVQLTATATTGSFFRWYKKEFGTPVIEETPTGSFTTKESLAVGQHVYFVTAVKDGLESVYKTPVRIVVSPVPVITLVPPINPEICGLESSVMINSSGNKQEKELFKEDFEGVVKFARTPDPTTNEKKATHWFVRNADYVLNPELYIAVRPALSSGFNGGNFANILTATSARTYGILNDYTSTVPIVTTGVTDVKLDFDLYYFSEEDVFEKNWVRVQYSIDDGANWVTLRSTAPNANDPAVDATYIKDIGTPGRFYRESIILPAACENKSNLKIRYSVFALGNSSEFIANVVAIDNVRVYGNIDTPPLFSWTINGVSAGSATDKFIIKPTTEEIQNNISFEIIAYAETANGCTISSTPFTLINNSKIWMSTTSTNWSDIKWKPGASLTNFSVAPTKDQCVIIKEPIIVGTGINGLAKNITIQHAGALNIESGASLAVTDFFKNEYKENNVESGNNVVIESGGNFIQTNDNAPNIGSLTAKRTISLTNNSRQQYNYVISPVENFSLAEIYKDAAGNTIPSPAVLYHNEGTNKFKNSSGAYIKGRALAVKEPAIGFAENSISATFHGRPVNGLFTYTLINSNSTDSNRGYNLIGNPYPSNMDLIQFYKDNSADGTLSPTFYLWDNKANAQTVQMGDTYGGQAYALFNASTPPEIGTPTRAAVGDTGVAGVKEPTRYVTVGQGFMAKVIKASSKSVTFKNTLRTAESATGFFGRGNTNENSVNRYWLNLISPANIASNIAVVYFAEGINAFTQDDSRSMGGSDALYSLVDEEKVSINGKSSFTNSDVVLLGATHFVTGSYTIALDKMEGIFDNGQNIYLKDKQAKTVTNLSAGPYTFAAEAGQSTERFEIIYKPDTVLVTDASIKETIIVYRDGNDFVIKSQSKKIGGLEIYDAAGRLMDSRFPNQKEVRIEGGKLVNGIYLLKITQDGKVTTKKIIR